MKYEEPKVTKEGSIFHEDVYTHPAYGQISVSRVSGGNMCLYGSDFHHNGFIRVEISESEMHRDLSHDWYYPKKSIIEIFLSEAQWATFVSSFGIGAGTPCTIRSKGLQGVPQLPETNQSVKKFSEEMEHDLKQFREEINEIVSSIDDLGISKKKAEALKLKLSGIVSKSEGHAKFVGDSFDEHMEKTVERAKSEVHGYASRVITEAGINALNGKQIIEIEQKD